MYNRLTSLSPSISELLQPGLHSTLEEDSVQLPTRISVRCHAEQLPQLLWWLRDSSGWEGRHRKPAALGKHCHSHSSEWRCPWDTCSWGLGWFLHLWVQFPCWRLLPAEYFIRLGSQWDHEESDSGLCPPMFHTIFKYRHSHYLYPAPSEDLLAAALLPVVVRPTVLGLSKLEVTMGRARKA